MAAPICTARRGACPRVWFILHETSTAPSSPAVEVTWEPGGRRRMGGGEGESKACLTLRNVFAQKVKIFALVAQKIEGVGPLHPLGGFIVSL